MVLFFTVIAVFFGGMFIVADADDDAMRAITCAILAGFVLVVAMVQLVTSA